MFPFRGRGVLTMAAGLAVLIALAIGLTGAALLGQHRSANADRANFLAALPNNTMTIEGIGVAILASDEFFANAANASGTH